MTSSRQATSLDEVTLYRYGLIAWFWRPLIFGGLIGGGFLFVVGYRLQAPEIYPLALSFILPALFFGHVVATSVVRREDGWLRITTLLFERRLVARPDLGVPRVKLWAQGRIERIYAPRVWIPVHGGLPIYLDLLADIPDLKAFANMFGLNRAKLPRKKAPQEPPER